MGEGLRVSVKIAMDEPRIADLLEELAGSLNVTISSAEGLLRQTRRKVIGVIGKKHPRWAEKLGRTYGEGELVKEVELTQEFFSEVKGKCTEQTDKVIEEMEGMIYGEAKIVSIVVPVMFDRATQSEADPPLVERCI